MKDASRCRSFSLLKVWLVMGVALGGLLSCAGVKIAPPSMDSRFGREVARCQPAGAPGALSSAKHIWILKQWHVAPGVDTRDRIKAKELPQAANQTAIYQQLDQWVKAHLLDTVIAEGCSGELTINSNIRFNGWSVQDLASVAHAPGFDQDVISHVPMKLEAKYGDQVRTICGDDEDLLQKKLAAKLKWK